MHEKQKPALSPSHPCFCSRSDFHPCSCSVTREEQLLCSLPLMGAEIFEYIVIATGCFFPVKFKVLEEKDLFGLSVHQEAEL